MAMSGTLEEALGKAYELYMEGRVDDLSITWYFLHLRHEDGSLVFGSEDVRRLMEILHKDKADKLQGVLGV